MRDTPREVSDQSNRPPASVGVQAFPEWRDIIVGCYMVGLYTGPERAIALYKAILAQRYPERFARLEDGRVVG